MNTERIMERIVNLFLELCRYEICGEKSVELADVKLSDEEYIYLYKLSKHHDCAHLVSDALFKNGLITKENACYEEFKKIQMKAYYRYERIEYELGEVNRALESAEIPFIPLKGSVLRKFYPEPWMRTSTDIDILIKEDDLKSALELLKIELGYKYLERGSHDVSLVTKSGLLIELHFELVEEVRFPEAAKVLGSVWDYATPQTGSNYKYVLSDEMFYYYHIIHMAKHFENGGCGVRSFIDLWVLEKIKEHSDEKRNELLKKGKLLKFANAARSLSSVWFSGKEKNELDLSFENFIIKGGTFGTSKNGVEVKLAKNGQNKLKYIFSRVFLPMAQMKNMHPVLKKHPYLVPIFHLKRIAKLLNKQTRDRAKAQVSYLEAGDVESKEQMVSLLENLGL